MRDGDCLKAVDANQMDTKRVRVFNVRPQSTTSTLMTGRTAKDRRDSDVMRRFLFLPFLKGSVHLTVSGP